MDAKMCLEKLERIGVLAFATVDKHGCPQIRNMSAIHYEQDRLYFFTAKGKNLCKELLDDGKVQVLGYTKYKEMIRLSGKAKALSGEENREWISVIFEEQPYLENVYPDETRDIGQIFMIEDAAIEYFNLGVCPIFREQYAIGDGNIEKKGYEITSTCTQCGRCAAGCPQGCIVTDSPYRIQPQHCLHCGRCAENCPFQAIKRLE